MIRSGTQKTANLLRMNDIKDHHDHEHQQRIEDIQIHLMVQEVPVVPLNVFDQSEYGTDHDKETCQIKYIQVFAPGNIRRARAWHRIFLDFPVEMRRGHEKKGEEENLNH